MENKVKDRKLGDEWLDWDGTDGFEETETDYRVFLGLSALTIIVLILTAGMFLWLIYPRLTTMGSILPKAISFLYLSFSAILTLWLALFIVSAVFRWPITPFIIVPRLVNKLLAIAIAIGKPFGISADRVTNSFLKIHNILIRTRPHKTVPSKLLLLLPRCLTKETNKMLRELRDKYGFKMVTAGGGSEARKKIRELRPHLIIAIACERDLYSGFKEVNVHIPVIGFPNKRPEGPCKNTCIDLIEIERTIQRSLIEA